MFVFMFMHAFGPHVWHRSTPQALIHPIASAFAFSNGSYWIYLLTRLKIEHTKLAYYSDFGLYFAAALLLPVVLLHHAPASMYGALGLAGLCGLGVWTLIEYAMHRFLFHGVEPFQSLHAAHHRRPLALIATPTYISASLLLLVVWLPAVLVSGLELGSGLALGVTVGYFVYGVMHHGVHHWRAKGRWMRRCKREHAIHHHQLEVNYGVTMLWWDRAFGSKHPRMRRKQ
jgi:sterol desaturase/sphingolipid hydroxylase (fatty acid hydroxylase superfamily)